MQRDAHARPRDMAAKARPAAAGLARLPPIDERISFIIHQINARLAQVCNPLFRRYHLDLFGSRILVILLERGEASVGELVETMVLPQSTISHQLQRLEKQRLILRRRNRTDNRSVVVTLTQGGKNVARECNDLSAAVYRAMTENLSASELAKIRDLLRRVFVSLGDFRSSADARPGRSRGNGSARPVNA